MEGGHWGGEGPLGTVGPAKQKKKKKKKKKNPYDRLVSFRL
jgi:hypothetical protein